MPGRRDLLAAATGSLALTAGCVGRFDASDVVPCPAETSALAVADERTPVATWRPGTPIENPVTDYEPVDVPVVNFDVERRLSIVVTRGDAADGPVLERTVHLDAREYVRITLQEPAVWHVTVTLPDGDSRTRTVAEFDCNSRQYGVAVRCGGSFTTSEVATLAGCPSYPVGESGT